MPAITLGLAEVEERLRTLRRRLNSVTAQHSTYLGLSILLLAVTAVVVLALQASAATFRIGMWLAGFVGAAGMAACALAGRRRWLDVEATARLADRRGELTDRIATLVDLRVRPRPSRLAPLLVAQALALGSRWQPGRIAPRRVPRSVFLLLASLLALVSTVFLNRRVPPPPAPGTTATAGLSGPQAPGGRQAGDTLNLGGDPAANGNGLPGAGNLPPASAAGNPSLPGMHGDPAPADSSDAAAGELPETLADRLQHAIRQAFDPDAEHGQKGSQLVNRSRSGEQSGAPGADKRDRGAADANGSASHDQSTSGGRQRPQAEKSGAQLARNPDGANPPESFDGTSPAAGDGSSPGGLMDAKGAGVLGAEGTQRFKLTITSFLHAVDQKEAQPRQKGKRGSALGAAAPGGAAEVPLNERQLGDDPLRKTEVPPEYEDLVRRVYSLRTDP